MNESPSPAAIPIGDNVEAGHPELKSVDRRIAEIEEQLKVTQARIATKYERRSGRSNLI